MRIIAGQYGGRRLLGPKDQSIRPTSDKIRGSIFNILRGRGALDGAQVLDLFCGTGALGLEALSQGAAHCVFVDNNRKSLDLARANAAALGADNCDFILKDAAKLSQTKAPSSLVFLDPPYGKNLIPAVLENLQVAGLLHPGAVLIAEEDRRSSLLLPPAFSLTDERIYGDTKILFINAGALE